ncbi:TetR/AcrR family transcriptional regulator [uncultured Tessaracoccus sp.]|uniref:TetR/AcrR family transcriptional regulator n=1 Tax=uncultured Tessaracoccus sp. TaxID=905023 RepID=UPI00261F0B3E|nr:TetR family transcriptional regulator [uncultured Tessaracoccus sp.]
MHDDLTSRARLRDAMIELVDAGQTPTARGVAERAGLSPGLIRHHFGSMDALISECDSHIAGLVRQSKEKGIAQGASVDVLALFRETGNAHILGYLARRLGTSSPQIDALVDQMAADAAGYIQTSIDDGLLKPLPDVDLAAKMLTLYALGSLVLHEHMERLIGIDITQADLSAEPGFVDYVAAQFAVFSGLYTDEVVTQVLQTFQAQTNKDQA